MDKIRILANVGIGLAAVDFIVRGFGPLYTTQASNYGVGGVIWAAIMPAVAIISSLALKKAKKWGLYLTIVLVLIAIIGATTLNILPILYLIIYGILVVLGFQQSKNLK